VRGASGGTGAGPAWDDRLRAWASQERARHLGSGPGQARIARAPFQVAAGVSPRGQPCGRTRAGQPGPSRGAGGSGLLRPPPRGGSRRAAPRGRLGGQRVDQRHPDEPLLPDVAAGHRLARCDQRGEVPDRPAGGENPVRARREPGLLRHPGQRPSLERRRDRAHLVHGRAVVEERRGEVEQRRGGEGRGDLVPDVPRVVEVVGLGEHPGHQLAQRGAGLLRRTRGPAAELGLRVDPGEDGTLALGRGAQVVGELVDQGVSVAAEALGVVGGAECLGERVHRPQRA
jgi:hypothetical protein